MGRLRQNVGLFFKASIFLLLVACGAPPMDMGSSEGRAAIIVATNKALSDGECLLAINLIEPLYNSPYVTNQIRLIRASAQGCYAGVPNFLGFIDSLTSSNLIGGEFWVSMARLFPYTDLIGVQAGWNATDAVMAALRPGQLVASAYEINSNTANVGSELVSDRTDDANAYLVFASMAVIGRTETRFGAPNASFQKTQNLPWSNAAAMTNEGCAYAGAVVNMLDGLNSIINMTTGSVKTTLQLINSTFQSAVGTACEAGCVACGFAPGSCTQSGSFCPIGLRYRNNCQPVITNKNTCAAVGVVNMINSDPLLKWPL